MNINWNEKPDWAVGHAVFRPNDSYVWFSDTHYQYIGSGNKYSTLVPAFKFDYLTNVQYAPAKEWDGKGFPPVGIKVEVNHHEFGWTPADVVGPYEDYMICAPSGGGFYGYDANEIRPIKSDKEKWVDQVIRIYDEKDEGARENFARLYDAMQSGILPTPKGDNIDLTGVAALDALYDAMVSGEQPYKR